MLFCQDELLMPNVIAQGRAGFTATNFD